MSGRRRRPGHGSSGRSQHRRHRRRRPRSRRGDHVRRRAGAGHRRPGQAGARRDGRRRHRRRQRQGFACAGRSTIPASSAATRWPAASSTGSTAPQADMFNGAVWVLTPGADTDDAHVRHRDGRRQRARRRGRGDRTRTPRPARRRRQPRAAPHRGDADGARRRPRRGARRAAAAGRRRVPRHDPHRQRAARHLARHLRREPPGDRRRARRADRAV